MDTSPRPGGKACPQAKAVREHPAKGMAGGGGAPGGRSACGNAALGGAPGGSGGGAGGAIIAIFAHPGSKLILREIQVITGKGGAGGRGGQGQSGGVGLQGGPPGRPPPMLGEYACRLVGPYAYRRAS
ncbi:hypothetical protein WME94_10890 [Sorangium sp. So ce429]